MEVIRDIEDFPKPGIVFKDITPILKDASLCNEVVDAFAQELQGLHIDAIVILIVLVVNYVV